MNRVFVVLLVAVALAGCAKSKKPDASASATAAESSPPPKPFVQKGVPEGKLICGYVQDLGDASKCSAVVDAPEGKEVFARAGDHYAQIVHGKVVPSCPTDNVVGICDNGRGLLTNYSGPKWTPASAKKNCTSKSGQTWLE
jgi:hypothetical protein